jgi:hypothetical protein
VRDLPVGLTVTVWSLVANSETPWIWTGESLVDQEERSDAAHTVRRGHAEAAIVRMVTDLWIRSILKTEYN